MSHGFTYLERYSIAPPPSRDYYGLKVHDCEIKFFHWRISHGPYKTPLVQIADLTGWKCDKELQESVGTIFGQSCLEAVNDIALNRRSLLALPEALLKKILEYLTVNDILKLTLLSRAARDVFSSAVVWETLAKRIKGDNENMAQDWKQLLRETKDIEKQYGVAKHPRGLTSTTRHQKTLANSKLSPRPQLEIIRTISTARRIAEESRQASPVDRHLITRDKPFQERYSRLSDSGQAKPLVSIVNLEAEDIEPASSRHVRPSKTTKSATAVTRPKTASTMLGRPSRKMDLAADLAALRSNDLALDDLIRHTLKDLPSSKGAPTRGFNWLGGLSAGDHAEDKLSKYQAQIARASISPKLAIPSSSLLDTQAGLWSDRASALKPGSYRAPHKLLSRRKNS